MIISFLNQKGGVGKSTVARSVAVAFINSGWDVHVADTDIAQRTTFEWSQRRNEAGILPAVDVSSYVNPKNVIKTATLYDLLIIDGKAFADSHALEVALASDLIVLPVGVSTDDLEPTIKMAVELVKKGVSREKILFIVCKVPTSGDKEAMLTRQSIIDWNFDVAQGWIPFKTGYSKAMDSGKTIAETPYTNLNERAERMTQSIYNKANFLMGEK